LRISAVHSIPIAAQIRRVSPSKSAMIASRAQEIVLSEKARMPA
jgi:hypothetical protein